MKKCHPLLIAILLSLTCALGYAGQERVITRDVSTDEVDEDLAFSGAISFSGATTFTGSVSMTGTVAMAEATEVTVTSGTLAVTAAYHTVQPESGTTDTITAVSGLSEGEMVYLGIADAGTDSLTITHSSSLATVSGQPLTWTQGVLQLVGTSAGAAVVSATPLTAGNGLTGNGDGTWSVDADSESGGTLVPVSVTSNGVAIGVGSGLTATGHTITVLASSIDHDALSNYVAAEHVDHSGVSITAGDGLTGGGTIESSRTMSVDPDSESGGTIAPVSVTANGVGIGLGDGMTATSHTLTILADSTTGGDVAPLSITSAGAGLDVTTLDGDHLGISWSPDAGSYTPDATPSEADDAADLTAHLQGVATALAARAHSAGAMMTSTYDTDSDGLVDAAELVTPASTSVGDILVSDGTDMTLLALGAADYVLSSTGAAVVWTPASGGAGGIEVTGAAQGDILYYDDGSSAWTLLTPGTTGYQLTSTGAGSAPEWSTDQGVLIDDDAGDGDTAVTHSADKIVQHRITTSVDDLTAADDRKILHVVEGSSIAADANTILLLQGEGADDSTTITDSSPSPLTLVNSGGNIVNSIDQAKFGNGSVYSPSANNVPLSVTIPAIGTGDFVFDFWTYPLRWGGSSGAIGSVAGMVYLGPHNGPGGFYFGLHPNGGLKAYDWVGSQYLFGGSNNTTVSSVPLNTWTHIKFTRVSGVVYLFVGGALVGSKACTSNFTATTLYIGGSSDNSNDRNYNGYLDEYRYSDISRGTTAYTPPTASYTAGPLGYQESDRTTHEIPEVVTDGGSADSLTAALADTLTDYADCPPLLVKVAADNTGAATIDVDSVGAKSIKLPDGSALNAGNLQQGGYAHLVYDGTNFILLNPYTAVGASNSYNDLDDTPTIASRWSHGGSTTLDAYDADLVAGWAFDTPIDGTGDVTGQVQARWLEGQGATPTRVRGHVGGSAYAPDANEGFKLPNDDYDYAALLATETFSLSFWYKAPSSTSADFMGYFGTGSTYYWYVDYTTSVTPTVRVRAKDGSTYDMEYADAGLSSGWHHVVVTSSSGSATLYVDGTSRDTVTWTIHDIAVDIGLMGITNDAGATNVFAGDDDVYMDAVYIWDTAISAAAVTALYNSGTGRQWR